MEYAFYFSSKKTYVNFKVFKGVGILIHVNSITHGF